MANVESRLVLPTPPSPTTTHLRKELRENEKITRIENGGKGVDEGEKNDKTHFLVASLPVDAFSSVIEPLNLNSLFQLRLNSSTVALQYPIRELCCWKLVSMKREERVDTKESRVVGLQLSS